MTIPSRIKGLILDYGEVLCRKPHEAQIARMAEVFGICADRFAALYDESRRAYDLGDLTPERYWFSFADVPGAGLRADQVPLLRAWDVEMWSDTRPEMLEWLQAANEFGLRTALLSNMPVDMIGRVRSHFAWFKHFDCAVFSQEVHLAKPQAAIYEYCLRELGSPASETVFIDDREVNVRAALELGLIAIRFESVSQLRGELERIGFPILPVRNELTASR